MGNELIKITTNEEGKQLVSARELYEGLKYDLTKGNFSHWIEKQLENVDAVENIDFTRFVFKNEGNNANVNDYILTLDIAKEICMVVGVSPRTNEETKKLSKDFRRYFIECEKQLKNNKPSLSREQELVLKIYNGGVESVQAAKELTEMKVKEAVEPLNNKIELDRPKVEFTETILKSKDNILVRELAKIISDEVVKIGQNKLYDKLREWNYIMKGKTEPYQSAIDKGYFVVKESKVETPYGVKLTKTTLVTPLGQIKIVEKFRREYKLDIDK